MDLSQFRMLIYSTCRLRVTGVSASTYKQIGQCDGLAPCVVYLVASVKGYEFSVCK